MPPGRARRTTVGRRPVKSPSSPAALTVDLGPMARSLAGRISVAARLTSGRSPRTPGERIAVHIGEIVDDNDFRPWIRLLAPSDAVLGDTVGRRGGGHRRRGRAGDRHLSRCGSPASTAGFDGTGTYRLTMTHTPGPITVSPGDQGGPLTNGAIHDGRDSAGRRGRLDVHRDRGRADLPCTSARSPTRTTSGRGFGCGRPTAPAWATSSGVAAAVIDDVVAPVTGTYLVLVASFDSGFDGDRHVSPDDDAHAGPDHGVAGRSGWAR